MIEIRKPVTVVGRGDPEYGWVPDIDLAVYDTNHYVSRQHLRLHLQPGVCLVEDLGSRNGLFLNGRQQIFPGVRIALQDGDVLSVFNFQITYRFLEGRHFLIPVTATRVTVPTGAGDGTVFLGSPPAGSPQAPSPADEAETQANRRFAWVLVVSAAVLVVCMMVMLFVIFSGPSDMDMVEKVRRALDEGRFFEPVDNCVAGLYRNFVARYPRSSSRAYVEQSIRDRFEADGNAAFARYTRNPYEAVDWADLQKKYEFLSEMLPQELDLAARRRFSHGARLLGLRDYAGALREFREAARLRPRWFLPFYASGLALEVLGDPACLEEYAKAAELEPGFLWAFKEAGDVHFRNQAWDKAYDTFQPALAIGSLQPDLFFDFGETCMHLERFDEARQGFRKYVLYGTDAQRRARARELIRRLDGLPPESDPSAGDL